MCQEHYQALYKHESLILKLELSLPCYREVEIEDGMDWLLNDLPEIIQTEGAELGLACNYPATQ